jgi:hypothetical protein
MGIATARYLPFEKAAHTSKISRRQRAQESDQTRVAARNLDEKAWHDKMAQTKKASQSMELDIACLWFTATILTMRIPQVESLQTQLLQ